MVEYGLNIVFYMKSYAQLLSDDKTFNFDFTNLNFTLTKLNDKLGSYSLIIKPLSGMEQAENILNNMKLAFSLFVLENNFTAIEIDYDIKTAKMLKKPRYISDDILVAGDFYINQTTLFPLVDNLAEFKSNPISVQCILSENDFKDKIIKAFSLDYESINDDEKLLLALEIYTEHSQFSRKRQFLDLITILEILKPEYNVSEKSLETIAKFKKEMKKLRKSFNKDSDEYGEFSRYFTDLGYWKTKSINKSLQQFVKEYQNEFKEYEDIDAKVKKAYDIRSNIVHKGIIDEEFDVYFEFLKNFVGKLLKIMIIEKK